jgi:hypothetical protein
MPCYDGREDEDKAKAARDLSALSALLCGIFTRTEATAVTLAERWCLHHKQIDEYRKSVRYDHEDSRIRTEQLSCSVILDIAFQALCTNDPADLSP